MGKIEQADSGAIGGAVGADVDTGGVEAGRGVARGAGVGNVMAVGRRVGAIVIVGDVAGSADAAGNAVGDSVGNPVGSWLDAARSPIAAGEPGRTLAPAVALGATPVATATIGDPLEPPRSSATTIASGASGHVRDEPRIPRAAMATG